MNQNKNLNKLNIWNPILALVCLSIPDEWIVSQSLWNTSEGLRDYGFIWRLVAIPIRQKHFLLKWIIGSWARASSEYNLLKIKGDSFCMYLQKKSIFKSIFNFPQFHLFLNSRVLNNFWVQCIGLWSSTYNVGLQ